MQLASQILCLVLARRHLAQDVPRAYRLWSVALCQVLKANDGIRRAWSVVASRQKGVAGGESTVNQAVANNWTVLPKGTLVRGVSGVEIVWYVHFPFTLLGALCDLWSEFSRSFPMSCGPHKHLRRIHPLRGPGSLIRRPIRDMTVFYPNTLALQPLPANLQGCQVGLTPLLLDISPAAG